MRTVLLTMNYLHITKQCKNTILDNLTKKQVCGKPLLRFYKTPARHKKKRGPHSYFMKNIENEVLFGRSVCLIALKSSRRSIFELMLLRKWETEQPDDDKITSFMKLARERNIPITFHARNYLDTIVNGHVHQGICLQVSELNFMPIVESMNLLSKLKDNRNSGTPLVLYLHDIKDVMNIGNIIRSAFYFNVDQIIVSDKCPPLTPIVAKASSGASEMMEILSTSSHEELFQSALASGWDVVGTVPGKPQESSCNTEDVSSFNVDKPMLVIIGSEGKGLDENIINNYCTRLVTIKSHVESQEVDSLNVGNATAIILHNLRQKTTES